MSPSILGEGNRLNLAAAGLELIIPTHKRPVHLARCLRFYDSVGFMAPIRVLDSSDPEIQKQNRQTCAQFQGRLRIEVQQFPADTSFYTKLAEGLEGSESPFVCYCADDDFILPASLKACVAFLRDRPAYSAAIGPKWCFEVLEEGDGAELRLWAPRLGTSLDADTAAGRLRQLIEHPYATFYSVHRREQHLENWRRTRRLGPDPEYRFGEKLSSFLTVVAGKLHRFDHLHVWREVHPTQAGQVSPLWPDMVRRHDYEPRYQRFRALLAEPLAEIDGISLPEAEAVVDECWTRYLRSRHALPEPPSLTDRLVRKARTGALRLGRLLGLEDSLIEDTLPQPLRPDEVEIARECVLASASRELAAQSRP